MTALEPDEWADAAPTGGHDDYAERVVLAACLNHPAAVARARRALTPDSFWRRRNGELFAAMLAVDDTRKPVDPYTVYRHLADSGTLHVADNGAHLHTLFATPYTSAPYAISRVAKLARNRARAAVAQRFAQIAEEVTDPDHAADLWSQAAVELEVLIDDHDESDPVAGLSTWDEFLAQPVTVSESVVPGLLDRQEAVMILAAPGVGKSWLSRQVALTVAAGVHPFRPSQRIDPQRTLLIDLENPESTVKRQVHDPYAAIQLLADGTRVGDRGWVWRYPAGLNIRKRADASLLERVIDETRPALVCVGSLYNLFNRGSSDWDTAAEETIALLNRLRARYGCAWWIEHHMPRNSDGGHRSSPFGSTLWERWPSYGRTIKRIGGEFYDFEPFRGDREAGRDFPPGLKRGGRLPWSAIWDAEDLELIRENFRNGR